MCSAIISFAPFNASSTVFTSFSSLINASASFSNGSFVICKRIRLANGSNPFSFAIIALVRFFCLYGRYKSSTATSVFASSICFASSFVSLPCSSIFFLIASLRSSKFLKYNNLSWKLRSVSSSNDPVISFRYLAMNGIVLPSSISLIVVSTCPRLIPSSSCKILIISISSPYKSTSIVCPFGTNWRYLTPAISNIFFDAFVVSLPAYLSCI